MGATKRWENVGHRLIHWWHFGILSLAFSSVLLDVRRSSADPIYFSGNGHWYEPVLIGPGGISWTDARDAAIAKGGYLATITSAEENAFVYGLVSNDNAFWVTDPPNGDPPGGNSSGPWLGGYQIDKNAEPAGDWAWVTGEPWSYTNWATDEPSNFGNDEDYLTLFGFHTLMSPSWNDVPLTGYANAGEAIRGYVVEYIPEPASLSLLVVGAGSLLIRRHCWRKEQ